ncbi:MAG TPA: peptidase MA family metallohydrolase [Myxococcota bacterium]|nr:peptidase MA family metallohydrolase [Myxococcota bacterium]
MLAALLTLWLGVSDVEAQEWSKVDPAIDLSLALEPPTVPMRYVSLAGTYATVHGRPRDKAALERVAEHVAVSIPAIAERLGIGAGPTMNIYLADDEQAFDQLQPGVPPDWADGTAWPQRGLIYLKSPRIRPGTAKPLMQVLDHEVTHVLLGQAFGREPVPRWLQEGLAQWVAGEIGPDLPARIGRGAWRRDLYTLDEITADFPADPSDADLAYAQSADLIAFVATEYGEEAIPNLVQALASGRPVNAAFLDATGELASEVDQKWRARLSSGFISFAPLADDFVWLGLAAPLILIAFWGRRRRNKKVLALWQDQEQREDDRLRKLLGMWDHPTQN